MFHHSAFHSTTYVHVNDIIFVSAGYFGFSVTEVAELYFRNLELK